MNRTRVMIVDDHQVVRAGLKTLINGQPDLAVVTEASSGREAMEQLRQHTIDVLLLDLSLPDVSGLDVLKHAKAHYESVGVLILSAFPEAQYGLNVLRGGASGFVGKGTEESELFRAIRTVARGGRYVGPERPPAQHPLRTRIPDLLQARARRIGVGDRESAFPVGEDSQYLPEPHPREDVHEEQCRHHHLRTAE